MKGSGAEIQVLTGFDGDTPVLRPPARQATAKNLVTHTSGLGYWFWSEDLVKWESVTGIPNVVAGSAASFKAPMVGDPGEAFIYGINIDWLGKVVEAVTGSVWTWRSSKESRARSGWTRPPS